MRPTGVRIPVIVAAMVLLIAAFLTISRSPSVGAANSKNSAVDNAVQKVEQGQQIFRFDTFGDQTFWGDTLKLHQAIEGAGLGGVGPGVSPKSALAVGLKVDMDALPSNLLQQLLHGKVDLNDPAVTSRSSS